MSTPELYQFEDQQKRRQARIFLAWLYVVSVVMIFAGLTSALVVRKAEGRWTDFAMPGIFHFSTLAAVASSLLLHWAYLSAQRQRHGQMQMGIILSTFLGILFLAFQFVGYQHLVKLGVFLVGNPSGSFFYVIVGMHGVHVVAGIIALLVTAVAAIRHKIYPGRTEGLKYALIFWHSLGLIWIYLYVFLQTTY